MTRLFRACLSIGWLLYLVSLPLSWPLLPAFVGDNGMAVPRTVFVLLMLVLMGPLPWMTSGRMRRWLKAHPSLLSIPNKAYWLAPARAEQSWARLEGHVLAISAMVLLAMAVSHYQLVARAQGWWSLPPTGLDWGAALWTGLMLALVLLQFRQWHVSESALKEDTHHGPQVASDSRAQRPQSVRRPNSPGVPRHGQRR